MKILFVLVAPVAIGAMAAKLNHPSATPPEKPAALCMPAATPITAPQLSAVGITPASSVASATESRSSEEAANALEFLVSRENLMTSDGTFMPRVRDIPQTALPIDAIPLKLGNAE